MGVDPTDVTSFWDVDRRAITDLWRVSRPSGPPPPFRFGPVRDEVGRTYSLANVMSTPDVPFSGKSFADLRGLP